MSIQKLISLEELKAMIIYKISTQIDCDWLRNTISIRITEENDKEILFSMLENELGDLKLTEKEEKCFIEELKTNRIYVHNGNKEIIKKKYNIYKDDVYGIFTYENYLEFKKSHRLEETDTPTVKMMIDIFSNVLEEKLYTQNILGNFNINKNYNSILAERIKSFYHKKEEYKEHQNNKNKIYCSSQNGSITFNTMHFNVWAVGNESLLSKFEAIDMIKNLPDDAEVECSISFINEFKKELKEKFKIEKLLKLNKWLNHPTDWI